MHARASFPSSPVTTGSPLHAQHLLEHGHDLDEIALVLHHLVDVLVGARDLVEHAVILAALDAAGLVHEVAHGERALGLAAAHAAARAVRRGLERFGVAQPAHDVGP